jgi:hypothetical protein
MKRGDMIFGKKKKRGNWGFFNNLKTNLEPLTKLNIKSFRKLVWVLFLVALYKIFYRVL